MKVGTQVASKPQNSLASIARAQAESKDFSTAILGATLQNQIAKSVPDERSRARFTAAIVEAVSTNTQLQQCEPASIVSAALRGEGQGLILGHGYYVVPYGSKATYITSFKGYISLAMSTGLYADIDCVDVRDGEFKGRDRRTGKQRVDFTVYETDEEREAQPVIGYYGYFELKDGYFRSEYWSMDKLLKHAERYSPAFSLEKYNKMVNGELPPAEFEKLQKGSPWYSGTDGMCKKTVLRSLLNSGFAPLSNEVKNFIANDRDILIDPVEPKQQATWDDPLRNVIDTTATVKNAEAESIQKAVEVRQIDSKAEGKEVSTPAPKTATTSRKTAQKPNHSDPLRGNMNPPIEKAEAEEAPYDDSIGVQQSLFDQMGR